MKSDVKRGFVVVVVGGWVLSLSFFLRTQSTRKNIRKLAGGTKRLDELER